MNYIKDNLEKINTSIPEDVTLVAVSKTKPIADLQVNFFTNTSRKFLIFCKNLFNALHVESS
jgi:uncharacterized pyridoxal phosphate-containing UPF0001 family protein